MTREDLKNLLISMGYEGFYEVNFKKILLTAL